MVDETEGAQEEQGTLRRLYDRIFSLKSWQRASILLALAILFYVLSYVTDRTNTFLSRSFQSIGVALMIVSLIDLTYDWFIRKTEREELKHLFEKILNDHDGRTETMLLRALTLEESIVAQTIRREKVDDILRACLYAKLLDRDMSDEILESFLSEVFRYQTRWYNVSHNVTLTTLDEDELPQIVKEEFYRAVIHFHYSAILRHTEFIFRCTQDIETYKLSAKDEKCEYSWFLPPSPSIKSFDEKSFRILKIEVDDVTLEEKQITTTEGLCEIVFTSDDITEKLNRHVVVDYMIETMIAKRGNLFFTNVSHPYRGLAVTFDFAKTDIHSVITRDFFVSAVRPHITYVPPKKPQRIKLTIEDWVFPKSGVIFVWRR